jgi:hypothetical protein
MLPFWWWTPQSLNQPILPGWSFGNITITEKNSSAPATEHEIVSEHSYGRQLGRMMDAMAALIEERPASLPRNQAFDELLALRDSIEKIKTRAAAARLARLESDLERLKAESPQDYRRIAAKLAGDEPA